MVLVADGLGDGEAESGPGLGLVGLVEAVEDFSEIFFPNSGAVVYDGEIILAKSDRDLLLAVFGGVVK